MLQRQHQLLLTLRLVLAEQRLDLLHNLVLIIQCAITSPCTRFTSSSDGEAHFVTGMGDPKTVVICVL